MRKEISSWKGGACPVSVVMISLNEAHNMRECLDLLVGWAEEVFLVDSYSKDATVDIALEYGVHVVQRRFTGFGDQWNFAISQLPISTPWILKLDPDERLSTEFKISVDRAVRAPSVDAYRANIRLHFMDQPLPVSLKLTRLFRSGSAVMSNSLVNEHLQTSKKVSNLSGFIEHKDSPNLHHWLHKQNQYSSAEAKATIEGHDLPFNPSLFGTKWERRMWLKKYFLKVPFRFFFMFFYYYFYMGLWRAGKVGLIWCRLRCDVHRLHEYKVYEMRLRNSPSDYHVLGVGEPDSRVKQYS